MKLQELRERRHTLVTEARSLMDRASSEDRDLNDQEQTRFDEIKGELATVDNQIERREFVDEAERTMATDPAQPRRGNDGAFEERCREFRVTRAIAHRMEPESVDAGLELEIGQELQRRSGAAFSGIPVPHEVFLETRANSAGSDPAGGYLVGTTHRGDLLIDRLRAALKVHGLGATVLNSLVGIQAIPKLTGSATGYWVADHGAVTASAHTFGSVALSPRTVGAEVEYSRKMIINASPAIEQLVRGDLANVLATAIDLAAIKGSGAGSEPRGVLNTTGIGSVVFGDPDGAVPAWAKILDLIDALGTDNALMGSLGWLTNTKAVKKMRSTIKYPTSEQFIMTAPGELAGYQVAQSTQVPADGTKGSGTNLSTIIFGNWADLLIGYWSAVDILVNPYHSDVYSKGGVKINALQDCDIAVRHTESFAAATDMVTS